MGALSLALLQNHQAVAIALLETGARTYYNTTPKEKDLSPIFICVQMQNKEMLEHMMNESYSQLEVKNSEEQTPILYAAINHYRDIVEYMSLRSKQLNEEDANSITILMHFLLDGDI